MRPSRNLFRLGQWLSGLTRAPSHSFCTSARASASREWFRRDAVPGVFGETFNPGNWNSGHVTLEDATVLFVTLKGGPYDNRLITPERLLWFSQNSATPTSKKGLEIIEHQANGRQLHVFIRPGKGEFLYAGQATYADHTGSKPIQFTLELSHPVKL